MHVIIIIQHGKLNSDSGGKSDDLCTPIVTFVPGLTYYNITPMILNSLQLILQLMLSVLLQSHGSSVDPAWVHLKPNQSCWSKKLWKLEKHFDQGGLVVTITAYHKMHMFLLCFVSFWPYHVLLVGLFDPISYNPQSCLTGNGTII